MTWFLSKDSVGKIPIHILLATPKEEQVEDNKDEEGMKDLESERAISDDYASYAHCFLIKYIGRFYNLTKGHGAYVCENSGDHFSRPESLEAHKRNGCYEFHRGPEEVSQDPIQFKGYYLLGDSDIFLVLDYESFLIKDCLDPGLYHNSPYSVEILLYTKYVSFIPEFLFDKVFSQGAFVRFDGIDCSRKLLHFLWKINKYFVNKLRTHNKNNPYAIDWTQ
jgi:hypothetical protein